MARSLLTLLECGDVWHNDHLNVRWENILNSAIISCQVQPINHKDHHGGATIRCAVVLACDVAMSQCDCFGVRLKYARRHGKYDLV
jgi:hypothetical protein